MQSYLPWMLEQAVYFHVCYMQEMLKIKLPGYMTCHCVRETVCSVILNDYKISNAPP
jgi:hypothetical protein